MHYLINPRRKRRKGRKKGRTAAQRRATRKMIAARRAKLAGRSVKRRRRRGIARSPVTRRKAVARKARRRGTAKRRRRRGGGVIRLSPVRGRIFRKNPRGFRLPTARGFIGQVQQAAMDAGAVVVGKGATRFIANLLPLPKEGMMNFVTQAVGAVIVGTVARQFVRGDTARFIMAGGLTAPIEAFAKTLPVIGPILGDDYLELSAYPQDVLGEGEDEAMGIITAGGEQLGAYPQDW